jgi:hypothetical protein
MSDKVLIIPFIALAALALLYYEASRPLLPAYVKPEPGVALTLIKPAPRVKITVIPKNDPSALMFKKFARDHQMDWRIEPGVSGTTYCALLFEKSMGFVVTVQCKDTLGEATQGAIDTYNGQQLSQKIGIGSK